MELDYITFVVPDLKSTITFYSEVLDFKIIREIETESGKIVFMGGEEGPLFEFIEIPELAAFQATGLTFSFKSKSPLNELRDKLISLGYNPSMIISKPPKPDYFTVKSMNDLKIEFTQ